MLISQAMTLLRRYGLNTVGRIVSLEEALEMDRPLVLKADTEEHKTDKKLVFVGLKTDDEIKEAFRRLEGYSVVAQPLVQGFELIVGALNDPTFGKVVMVGGGGIFAEIYRDVSFRAVPLSRKDVQEMLDELRISRIFEGFRGKSASKEAVVDSVLAVSRFVAENDFRELDINPLMVNENGAFAVDVRLIE